MNLVALITHKSAELVSISAECIGMLLAFIKTTDSEIFSILDQIINDKILGVHAKGDSKSFVSIVHCISIGYPPIVGVHYKR
jgi:hypothetical protein